MQNEARCIAPTNPLRDRASRFRQRYEACQNVLQRHGTDQRRPLARPALVASGEPGSADISHLQALADVPRHARLAASAERSVSLIAQVSAAARQPSAQALLRRQALSGHR
jgi:hypothetical protein